MINEKMIKSKISEYLNLLQKYGYILDNNNLKKFEKELNSLIIKRVYNVSGNAKVNDKELSICYENIEVGMKKRGEYYLDEVLFHEFSHVINAFHKSIYGKEKFNVYDYFDNRMKYNTIELLEKHDELLNYQDPCLGIVLLDEFIAQYIAQDLILKKYNGFVSNISKKIYSNDSNMSMYKDKLYTSKICEPPIVIETKFSCYPEFYSCGEKIINKYGYSVDNFIKSSLIHDNSKYILESVDNKNIEVLYKDLCYLGLILVRVYLLNKYNPKINNQDDPVYYPEKINKAMKKILSN